MSFLPSCVLFTVSVITLCAVGTVSAATNPPQAEPVSPGGRQQATRIAEPCPTFSWGAATGAVRFDLAVFDALGNDSAGYAEQSAFGDPRLRARIAAPALSWTPAGDDCLDEGGSYLWFVRAQTAAGPGEWSMGLRFEVDLDVGALAQAVRKEVTEQLSNPTTWNQVVGEAFSAYSAITLRLPEIGLRVRETEAGGPTEITVDPSAAAGVPSNHQANTGTVTPKASFTNPSAFRVSSREGVVFDDPTSIRGNIPAEGSGARFMWYTGKRALRAGYAHTTEWDDANVGTYSTAFGYITKASGNASTALGSKTEAKSYAETVIGTNNTDYVPTSTTGWNANDRLFVIGNGTLSDPHNALTMYKDGTTYLNGDLNVTGSLNLAEWVGPGVATVCRTATGFLAYCPSSIRYKEVIEELPLGLATVDRLNPVIFKWKDRDEQDLGFVAEEVAEIDPLLVTYNRNGEIEGVKYRQLTAVLVNAIQEHQEQMALQRAQIGGLEQRESEQRAEIAALKERVSGQEETIARLIQERAEEMDLIQAELRQLREQFSRESAPLRVALDH